MEKIRLEGTRFLNESGKEVLFQGINVLHRERENGHLFPDSISCAWAFSGTARSRFPAGLTWIIWTR